MERGLEVIGAGRLIKDHKMTPTDLRKYIWTLSHSLILMRDEDDEVS